MSEPQYRVGQGFPFFDLPVELQQNILGFTDLVAPFQIRWTAKFRYSHLEKTQQQVLYNESSKKYRVWFPTPGCDCWRIPSNLFLVSRTFGQLATEIFFSQNHFVLSTYYESEKEGPRFFHNLLASWSKPGLRYIRSLEFQLDHPWDAEEEGGLLDWKQYRDIGSTGYTQSNVAPGEEIDPDWIGLIDFISENMVVSKLKLAINFGEDEFEDIKRDSEIFRERHRDDCRQLVNNLRKLQELRGFHLYMSLYLFWCACDRDDENHPHKCGESAKRMEEEAILEKQLMGSEYDSIKDGKYPMLPDYPYRYIEPTVEACAAHRALGYQSEPPNTLMALDWPQESDSGGR